MLYTIRAAVFLESIDVVHFNLRTHMKRMQSDNHILSQQSLNASHRVNLNVQQRRFFDSHA